MTLVASSIGEFSQRICTPVYRSYVAWCLGARDLESGRPGLHIQAVGILGKLLLLQSTCYIKVILITHLRELFLQS